MKVQIELEMNVDVIDIPTMEGLDQASYASYVEEALMWVDHHDILRTVHGEYPIATNRKQIDVLIGFLQSARARMPE